MNRIWSYALVFCGLLVVPVVACVVAGEAFAVGVLAFVLISLAGYR